MELNSRPILTHKCFLKNIGLQMKGTVKFFNNAKGFGFITPEDGGKDVFVHKNGLSEDIHEGDKVSYDVEESPKGLNAINVRVD